MRLWEQYSIEAHWALEALGCEKIKQAFNLAENLILACSFQNITNLTNDLRPEERELIETVIETYEIAALELWHAARYPQDNPDGFAMFSKLCGGAFVLLRALPLPVDTEAKVSHILRVIALGYLSDHATDVQRWISEAGEVQLIPAMVDWDGRLASRIVETWIRLVRRENWEDVHQIAAIIVSLRQEQKEYEAGYLASRPDGEAPAAAWQLIAFYHWAKATEVLAQYMLQGNPADAVNIIDFHFDKSFQAAEQSGSFELGNLLKWFQFASHRFISNSVWNVSHRFNANLTHYVGQLVHAARMTLELLPPQRFAIFEEGLLDQTHNAVVVSLPTSSGKTQLAIFRILEAINHFGVQGWIAYTAPTRALVNQITARLRRELGPLKIRVEQLSGAAEVDQFETDLLENTGAFQVLVCTPEKLDVIIRQKKVKRDLILYIMDEAHNLEEKERGLKHELLLAMIKRDCPVAKFLLLTPFVKNGLEVARWLDPQAPGAVSLSINWQPNDRVIGKFWAEAGTGRREWRMKFESLATSHPSLGLDKPMYVGTIAPVDKTFNQIKNSMNLLAGAMAAALHTRGTSLIIAGQKRCTWTVALELKKVLPEVDVPEEVQSVIRFLEAEYGRDYPLNSLLKHKIAVHHSGLSDEARFLIEWLTEAGYIKVLCATTTIAQGINFPVNTILLASIKYPRGKPMKYKEFWNLAGRAGRIGQPGVGLIGIAAKLDGFGKDSAIIEGYLKKAHGDLLSTLLALYEEAKTISHDLDLYTLATHPAWSAFLQYLAHLFNQSDRDHLLGARLELTLRDTFGYISLERLNPDGARELLAAVRKYVDYLYQHPENAKLAEDTGFAPNNAFLAMQKVHEENLQPDDWKSERLFQSGGGSLRKLMGVMLRVPELSNLNEIAEQGLSHTQLADLTTDWVNGKTLRELAERYFKGTDEGALADCCDAIYGKLANYATWGLASLQKLSGLNFDHMDSEERRRLNLLPAMIYYGVNTEEAVLMRMNSVPRSLAVSVGREYRNQKGADYDTNPQNVLDWLASLEARQWERMLPKDYPMTGKDCHRVWRKMSGIE